jgi:uncharacterized protein involved in exopolysaccharide biosynthesis
MKTSSHGLIDYVYRIVQYRKVIIVTALIIAFVSAGISLVLPKWYKAKAVVLSPSDDSGLGLASLMENLPIGGFASLGGMSEQVSIVLAIFNSRTFAERVIEEFELKTRYETETFEETIEVLRERIYAWPNDDGTISLNASAKTTAFPSSTEEEEARILCRDMANYFIVQVDRINKRIKTEKARNTRLFIEDRYKQNIQDLEQAEQRFKEFQDKYGVIALEEQVAATITAAAELKAQLISKQVELNVQKQFVDPGHPEITKLESDLKALQNEYQEFYSKQAGDSTDRLFVSLEMAPEIGMKYLRRFRELKLQEKILEFILPQYEQAKIQESKDTPTLQILDPAVAPVKRSSPRRAIIVMVATLSSVLLTIIFIVIKEYLTVVLSGDSHSASRLNEIRDLLSTDLRRFKFKR